MKRFAVSFLFSLVAVATIAAQDFEYGKPEELKGLTRYTVDAGIDVKARTKIVNEITKALPQLVLSENDNDAEIMLIFMSKMETVQQGPAANRLHVGTGMVAIEGRDPKKPRLLMNFSEMQDNSFEKMPYTKFAREFIKVYKKANGLK